MGEITSFNSQMDTAVGPIDAFDRTHKCSLYSIVPEWFQTRMTSEPISLLLQMSEDEFEKKYNPSVTLKRLRTNFWITYNNIVETHLNKRKGTGKPVFSFEQVFSGICSREYFKNVILESDVAISYLIRVPTDYTIVLQEALDTGVLRLREILNFPLMKKKYNKDGDIIYDEVGTAVEEPDYKACELLLKVVAMLDLRVKGAIPQKLNIDGIIQKRNLNINANYNKNINVSAQELDKKILSIADLDEQLNRLTKETGRLMEYPVLSYEESDLIVKNELENTKKILNDK